MIQWDQLQLGVFVPEEGEKLFRGIIEPTKNVDNDGGIVPGRYGLSEEMRCEIGHVDHWVKSLGVLVFPVEHCADPVDFLGGFVGHVHEDPFDPGEDLPLLCIQQFPGEDPPVIDDFQTLPVQDGYPSVSRTVRALLETRHMSEDDRMIQVKVAYITEKLSLANIFHVLKSKARTSVKRKMSSVSIFC